MPLSESGASFFTVFFVTALINSRYFAIALSCSKKLPKNRILRVLTSHTLGDEAYAIEQGHDQKGMLLIRFAIFVCWVIFGVLGGVIAELFPNILPEGINIGFPASLVLLFLAISQLRDRPFKSGLITIPKVILGFIISGTLYYSLGKVYFWIPSIIILSTIYYIFRSKDGK